MPVESLVRLRDLELFTRSVGAGSPAVVLHGGPGAHHDYLLPQFDRLTTGRTLYYYDQRGGGRSPAGRNIDLNWRSHVDDLAELVAHWGISPVPIVGYSWGGLLALLYATTYPQTVSRLALISPASATATGRLEFERRFSERMQSEWLVKERQELRESSLRSSNPIEYQRRLFELSVTGYFRDPMNVRNLTAFRVTERTRLEAWSSLGEYDIREQIAELHMPALVMHGSHDPIPVATARETADLLGAEFVELTESGHCPHVEQTDEFADHLNRFLDS